jgi:hypothetical protein
MFSELIKKKVQHAIVRKNKTTFKGPDLNNPFSFKKTCDMKSPIRSA